MAREHASDGLTEPSVQFTHACMTGIVAEILFRQAIDVLRVLVEGGLMLGFVHALSAMYFAILVDCLFDFFKQLTDPVRRGVLLSPFHREVVQSVFDL
jgi:hypothetical protein